MHLAVAIVGFRNPDDIVRCLAALERSTHSDFEVIICENGGPAAYATLTASLPAALPGGAPVRAFLAEGNLGYGGGVNVCLRETPAADAWWVLNPDTEPHAEAMSALIERLALADCDAVGGVLLRADGTVQSCGGVWQTWLARAKSINHGARVGDPIDQRGVERIQTYLSGASMMVGRRFVETVGPLREDYFLYAEEVEWCLRGRSMGMRLGFAASAHVVHHHGTTTGAGARSIDLPRLPVFLDARNRMLLTRDLFPGKLPVVAVGALAALLLRFGKRGALRQLGFALSGWAAGLCNVRGAPPWLDP